MSKRKKKKAKPITSLIQMCYDAQTVPIFTTSTFVYSIWSIHFTGAVLVVRKKWGN